MGVLGVMFVIYLLAKEGFNWGDLITFMFALSNSFGIFLVIMLLGYGLVSLPKTSHHKTKSEIILKYHYFEANNIEMNKCRCNYELEDLVKIVFIIGDQDKYPSLARLRANDILRICPKDMVENAEKDKELSSTQRIVSNWEPINVDKMVELNCKIKN